MYARGSPGRPALPGTVAGTFLISRRLVPGSLQTPPVVRKIGENWPKTEK